MSLLKSRALIGTLRCLVYNELKNKIFFPKNLVAKHAQVRLFIVVNADKNKSVIFQQIFRQTKAVIHEREPLTVAKTIFQVYIFVVIDKIMTAGVIRRINIDEVNVLFVSVVENGKCKVVVALNHQVVRICFVQIKAVFNEFFQNRHFGF